MCGGTEKEKSALTPSLLVVEKSSNGRDMNNQAVYAEDSFSSLLELASNNDIEAFKQLVDRDASSINGVGIWYVRQHGSKQIVLGHRTPLMVAATYGSVDVLKLILSYPETDVNFSCGMDKSTALHCAASGGSFNAIYAVQLLLVAGASPDCMDSNGNRPFDVIVVPPKLISMRETLEDLLASNRYDRSVGDCSLPLSINALSSDLPSLSSSPEIGFSSSPSESLSSPVAIKFTDGPAISTSEKKEYPIDPSLPDIKNSIYATDEFRMFSFKIRPCSRAYSHDWTERGDMCEYAHGVFECWLHPAQYRTRLCKDGTSCDRRVCFFAHAAEELRPLYVSTGSAVPSPRSSASAPNVMDMAAAMSLLPGSPSSVSAMSPTPFGQPMSPSANGISHSSSAWPQPNVPSLHLPGSNLQSSRLRSSLSARDIPPEDLNMIPDFDGQHQLLSDMSCFSQPRPSPVSVSRSGRSKTLTPSNLEELFSSEISSPRYSDPAAGPRYSDPAALYSPTHKSAVFNQFQQLQSMLSPINTNVMSPSFGVSSPGRMSPRSMEPISPMSSRLAAFAQREKQQQQLRSLSSRDLASNTPASVVGSPVNSWSKWGSSNGKADWSANDDELNRLRRSSFEAGNNGEEPDLSWVQSLVKESPPEMMKEKLAIPVSGVASSTKGLKPNSQIESIDHSVLGAWLEQMQLDQLVV
ncbi:Zinc finger CCCH domain-containing protein [Quillaja saponaria]|uniref:Zinc finger CCCH domain-containing protein n=1 Tax=Quillaja saponaria TaxID=32244 RepID=A0AAD7VNJ3_QUISA|nr:Zinc finger CCCH domain-containing protein [Quillaja saponaria]